MRGAAALVAGIGAATLMSLSLPWNLETCADVCGQSSSPFTWGLALGTALYITLPVGILTAVLTWMLGVRPATAQEAAVRAALGEAASAGTVRAARTGAIDGLAVGAVTYVLAGAAHVVMETTHGWDAFSTSTDAWGTRAVEAVMVTAALTLAHVLAVHQPRRTPVERLREDIEAARPVRVGRRLAVIGSAGVAAVAVVVALALAFELAPGSTVTVMADVALGVAWTACVALTLAVALPWARGHAPGWVASTAAVAEAAGAPRLAAVLGARASSPTQAGGRTVMALGAVAFAVAAVGAPTGVHASDRLAMVMTVESPAPADLEERIAALGGVARVISGPALMENDPWVSITTVEPEDLRVVEPEVYRALTEHPGAAVSSADRLEWITVEGFEPTGIVPVADGWVTYADAASLTGEPNATGYLMYAADGADREAIANAVSMLDTGASSTTYSTLAGSSGGAAPVAWACGLAVILLPLAIGAVRAGSREAATLTALGAEAAVVRWALTVEGAVAATVGVAVGAATGVLARVAMTMTDAAHGSLTGIITDAYVGTALSSVAWATVLGWSAAMVAVFTAVTGLVAAATHLDTPAEALRDGVAA